MVVSEEPIVAIRGDALMLGTIARSRGRMRFGECMVLDEGWCEAFHYPELGTIG